MTDRSSAAIAVIPARFGSERLPGKPLLKETGKYLIQHVYERVSRATKISSVLVATDDKRIEGAVKSFGGNAVMTSVEHQSGTDRVAEAVAKLDVKKVINVQGDEADIPPELIDRLVDALDTAEMATLAAPFPDPKEVELPSRVKVVMNLKGEALYFSRSVIPHPAGAPPADPLLHVGIYGYTKACLQRLTRLPRSRLEKTEKLEQLRALENGIRIRVDIVDWRSTGGIDTPEDYRAFVQREGGS